MSQPGIVHLHEQRFAIQAHDPAFRQELGAWLHGLATLVERGEVESPPSAIAVVLLGPTGPEVIWDGFRSWDDLYAAGRALMDHTHVLQYDPSQDYEAARAKVVERWQAVKDMRAQQEQRKAAHLAEHPWACDHCPRRFRTERGAVQHERVCRSRRNTPLTPGDTGDEP